jgi:hypothetical protein
MLTCRYSLINHACSSTCSWYAVDDASWWSLPRERIDAGSELHQRLYLRSSVGVRTGKVEALRVRVYAVLCEADRALMSLPKCALPTTSVPGLVLL